MASFGQLTLIVLAGLCGPLLAASRRLFVPVVLGELVAGVLLGRSGAGLIKSTDPTIAFLGSLGFAVLMLVAGMNVPLRNRALVTSLGRAGIAAAASAVFAVVGGLAIANALDIGHPGVWAILLGTGSAAIVLPALQEAGMSGGPALVAIAWVTIADVATIIAVPLVLNPSHALRAGLGTLAVAAGAALVYVLARVLADVEAVKALRDQSRPRRWALDLRMSLLALFALCALAQWVGTSILVAGFAAGLIVALEGGPHRLSDQVSGVANGFLVPVFFVVLGASLDVRALVRSPSQLGLAASLIAGMVLVHLFAARFIRAPSWSALIVTAQLGVPAAVVQLGLADHVLNAGQGAAIILAALVSLAVCAAGIALARRAPVAADTSVAAGTSMAGRTSAGD